MGVVPFLAVALVVVTVVASLTTGQRLGEVRRSVFQLEMQAEQLRRRVADLEADTQQVARHLRALTNLRERKRETLADLGDELKALQTGSREIHVAAGLRSRSFELAEAAA